MAHRRTAFLPLACVSLLSLAHASGQTSDFHLKINAGGPAVGDWQADSSFAKGGKGFSFPGQHNSSDTVGAAPNAVYESVRHTNHRYDFSQIADGDYVVRLHFTDGFRSRERSMQYRIEGATVLDKFSIYEAAGDRTLTVLIKDFPVRVRDGNGLQIECFKAGGNDVFQAAVEVLSRKRYEELMQGKPMALVSKSVNPAPTPPVRKAPRVISPPSEAPLPPGVSEVKDEVSRNILRLTGGRRVRLVWAEVSSANDLMVTNGRSTLLYGLDTGEEDGQRLIFEEKGGYSKPIFTPSGQQILYTNQQTGKCHLVNWNGKGRREFAKGFASDCWRDPATGLVWVYVRNSVGNASGAMVRRRLDDPDIVETVWDKSPNGNATVPWFRTSADGRYAADAFPWPKCGVADLTKGSWKLRGNGCWTSIAPDNSYRHFYFMGNHTEVAMFDHGAKKARIVKLNTMDGMSGKKVYHPRWSSDPRFITVTGPERNPRSELYLGRFDSGFTRVEEWVRVTRDKVADYYGAAWIEPDRRAPAVDPGQLVARPANLPQPDARTIDPPTVDDGAKWPGSHRGLIYVWENNASENQVLDGSGGLVRICGGEMQSQARFNRHFGMDLRFGHFTADKINETLLSELRETNELTIEATILPENVTQTGPARIISFSSGSNERNFTLGQQGDQLVLRLRTPSTGVNGTSPEVSLGKVSADEATHVLVRYSKNRIDAYLNGRHSVSSDTVRGGFENWTGQQQLLFGDEVGGGRNWSGQLEGVAIYSRALTDQEISWHHASYRKKLSSREPAERLVVEAELVEVSRAPRVSEIGSYRRSIVRNLYRIRKVISGKAPAERDIVVTEWAVLARQPVAGAPGKVGDIRTLTLEPFDQHPELQSDWVQDDLSAFDLQVYHRIQP